MSDSGEQSKAGKAHVYGTPLLAVVLAVLGWLDSRESSQSAAHKAEEADKQAEVSQVEAQAFSETRLKRAYLVMQEAIEIQGMRIDDLEGWVVELEEFVEDQVEEDSPRNQRERLARAARLEEIREKKRERARKSKPSASKMPDYEAVQQPVDPFAGLE